MVDFSFKLSFSHVWPLSPQSCFLYKSSDEHARFIFTPTFTNKLPSTPFYQSIKLFSFSKQTDSHKWFNSTLITKSPFHSCGMMRAHRRGYPACKQDKDDQQTDRCPKITLSICSRSESWSHSVWRHRANRSSPKNLPRNFSPPPAT